MEDLVKGPLQGARQQVDNAIGQAVDRFAGMVPGSDQFTGQAKQTIKGALDTLQQQMAQLATKQGSNLAEKAPSGIGKMMGNILGGDKS